MPVCAPWCSGCRARTGSCSQPPSGVRTPWDHASSSGEQEKGRYSAMGSSMGAPVQVPFFPWPKSVCSNKQQDKRGYRILASSHILGNLQSTTGLPDKGRMRRWACCRHLYKVLMSWCSIHPSLAWLRGNLKEDLPRSHSSERERHMAGCCAWHAVADALQKTGILGVGFYRTDRLGTNAYIFCWVQYQFFT